MRANSSGSCLRSQSSFGAVKPVSARFPVRARSRSKPIRLSISAVSAAVRWSFQRIAGRSGASSVPSDTSPCIWPERPTAAGSTPRRASVPSLARTQSSGSCSAQSGCGVESGYPSSARASTPPPSSMAIALTPVVPTSSPTKAVTPTAYDPKGTAAVVRWPAPGTVRVTRTMSRPLGDLVARGSRSTVHAYGRGAVRQGPRPVHAGGLDRLRGALRRGGSRGRRTGATAAGGRADRRTCRRACGSVCEARRCGSRWSTGPIAARSSGGCSPRSSSRCSSRAAGDAPAPARPARRARSAGRRRRSTRRSHGRSSCSRRGRPPRLCHGDLHPSNVILTRDGPVIVDWFDASRGDPVADVARSSLMLLGDGANPPRHLPGADPATLGALTRGLPRPSARAARRSTTAARALAGGQRRRAHGRGGAARRAARGLAAVRAAARGLQAAAS